METTTPPDTCECGQPSKHLDGRCRRCYARAWRKARKVAGGPSKAPCVAAWFDWEVVERAWAGKPYGRRLTQAEREYLTSLAVQDPDWSVLRLTHLLGIEPGPAEALAQDVISGRVQVPARGVYGEAL